MDYVLLFIVSDQCPGWNMLISFWIKYQGQSADRRTASDHYKTLLPVVQLQGGSVTFMSLSISYSTELEIETRTHKGGNKITHLSLGVSVQF